MAEWAFGISIVALVLTFSGFFFQWLFYRWQTRQGERIALAQREQGERIAVSLISTVDQIYRRLRGEEPTELVKYPPEDILTPGVSDKFVRAGKDVELRLSGYLSTSLIGSLNVLSVVESPSGRRSRVTRVLGLGASSFDLRLRYPNDFDDGHTVDLGRYHIWWHLSDQWTERTGANEVARSQDVGWCEDAFSVIPQGTCAN